MLFTYHRHAQPSLGAGVVEAKPLGNSEPFGGSGFLLRYRKIC